MTAVGRVGDANELAQLVSFLVSPDATFITGAQMVIDGGMSIPKFCWIHCFINDIQNNQIYLEFVLIFFQI